ncbi:hypothetical protein QA641_16910 [Bradyrhizobium sp. CB1650]|uniref:hypothetical protein n=1 Tax=Bradyrhizobium sp. CB1650 TaxID=3039153 RepID=UPI002434F186|nr:hypothetical protein [Bradyrhizobium sp. CB1650]WGD55405.1 hypothetical protein QA641_16910 [Bradyrhizobium sp. CB1650]
MDRLNAGGELDQLACGWLRVGEGAFGGDAHRLAVTVMLRFKILQGEEEAYLARLTRRSQDPRVRALADGRCERQQIRLLQSGRDLLRPDPDKPTRGLLALGGIDFGAPAEQGKPDSVIVAVTASDQKGAHPCR